LDVDVRPAELVRLVPEIGPCFGDRFGLVSFHTSRRDHITELPAARRRGSKDLHALRGGI
jgi:hypothetical protein